MDEWVLKTHGFWWGIFEKPPNLMLLLLLQFCGSIRTGIARWSSFHVLGLRAINQKFHGSLTVGGCILSPEFYMVLGHMYRCPLPLKINRLKPPTKYRDLSKGLKRNSFGRRQDVTGSVTYNQCWETQDVLQDLQVQRVHCINANTWNYQTETIKLLNYWQEFLPRIVEIEPM